MIFLLWLVAVVCTSEDIELQTSSPVIADVVQTKSVHVLMDDELQFDAESETESGPEGDTTDMPESLIVFQEVTKLDDILRDENPIVVNDQELASRNENLELNEISNNLGDDDIVDVIHNFIADKDPMLQLFLSICFIHPSCYQDSPPTTSDTTSIDFQAASPLARDLAVNLLDRRTEKARNILISALMEAQESVKLLMFKYIEIGVGARGVSILATKKIIDSVKNIWISVNSDLEYAKSSLQELFYLLPLDTNEQVRAVMEVAEVIQTVPGKVESLYAEATQEGYNSYVSHSSWDSWKRNPKTTDSDSQ